jgi:ABC-type Fe3+ transport system permease subunit
MESVAPSRFSSEGFKASTGTGLFFFFAFFLVPALSTMSLLLFSEEARLPLSANFWKLLTWSYLWGFVQAGLSATLSISLALVPALYLAFRTQPIPEKLRHGLRFSGYFVFVLPASALALSLSEWLQPGMLAVVIAHVFWNVRLLTSIFYEKIRAWRTGEGFSLLESAQSLGASGGPISRTLLLPALFPEIKFWFSAIFLWSLYSFGTVLILGGGPGASTPEVLTFYHLFSLYEPSRLLVLLPLSIALNFLILGFLRRKILDRENLLGKAELNPLPSRTRLFRALGPGLLAPGLSFLFLLLLIFKTLLTVFTASPAAVQDSVLYLSHSILLAIVTVIFVCGLLLISSSARSSLHRFLFLGLGFSPAVLALAWSQSLSSTLAGLPVFIRILFTAGIMAISQWPLFDLWIQYRLRQMPNEIFESAATLGAGLRERIFKLRIPALRSVLLQSIALMVLTSFGDLLFAALFLQDWKTLPLWAQERAAQYDFLPAKIFLLSLWLFLFVGLLLRSFTKRQPRPC